MSTNARWFSLDQSPKNLHLRDIASSMDISRHHHTYLLHLSLCWFSVNRSREPRKFHRILHWPCILRLRIVDFIFSPFSRSLVHVQSLPEALDRPSGWGEFTS